MSRRDKNHASSSVSQIVQKKVSQMTVLKLASTALVIGGLQGGAYASTAIGGGYAGSAESNICSTPGFSTTNWSCIQPNGRGGWAFISGIPNVYPDTRMLTELVAANLGSNAILLGNTVTMARGNNSVAIGSGAQAISNDSTSLGANALAIGNNSVALGQNSLAARDNSVSVGNAAAGLTRSITNVAPGVASTDAVNLDQMRQATAQVLRDANTFSAKGVAAAMAIPAMPHLPPGMRWVGVAGGYYAGESALGMGFGYQIDENINVGAAISTSSGRGSRTGVRVQAGYAW
ncbi:YadA-like family protein [Variovorax paradoxus]|uniref:YadA-like family protein n=1 Tax=Variovorax paradoxus TaxID=34073 RepID=UPI00277E8AF7|nr:YadA-like family protein [Variovorax paradoxus]MDP9932690.1 hypothetical protein [Variovorax paradoxus]